MLTFNWCNRFIMKKPHIALIVNQPNWAYDFVARSIRIRLKQYYRITIIYSLFNPCDFHHEDYDLVYVFYWGDAWAKLQKIPAYKRIQEVASLRWADEMTAEVFYKKYLQDNLFLTTPSREIYNILNSLTDDIYLAYNGVEVNIFSFRPKSSLIKIGWVGAEEDSSKGFKDIIKPACENHFELIHAGGKLNRHEVAELYKKVDVVAVASISESQPLPLLEGMACGCFPVCTSVGLVPELIEDKKNGLIVERNIDSFREAFQWCSDNLQFIRNAGVENAHYIMNNKSWDYCVNKFYELFQYALGKANIPDSDIIINKPSFEPNRPYDNTSFRKSRNILNQNYWRFDDKLTELSYIKSSIKTKGIVGVLKTKLFSLSWWSRRFK